VSLSTSSSFMLDMISAACVCERQASRMAAFCGPGADFCPCFFSDVA